VGSAYDKYTQFATTAFGLATTEIGNLSLFNVQPVNFSVSYNVDPAIYAYSRPTAPSVPGDLTYNAPPAAPPAPIPNIAPITFDSPPTEPTNPAPVLQDFTQPGNLTAVMPDTTVDLLPIPTVVRPDYVLPDAPTLYSLDLPEAPVLDLPEFTGVLPNTNIDIPLADFTFTPEEYTSALLTKTQAQISTMLNGGTGLPPAVDLVLRERAYSAIDIQESRAIQQAVEEYSSRGFNEPSGILAQRVSAVRQNNQNQRSNLNRDAFIAEQQVAIENLRFSVTQGVALESALFQGHNEFMKVALDAAQTTQNLRVQIFNARVSLAQLNLSAYQTEAAVWREQLAAELNKLEVYRSELQAQQVIGELNTQQVQIYTARIQAVTELADLYRADISAAQLTVSTNQQLIDVERSQIQAYSAQVDAYKATWDTYRTQLDSNTVRANVYDLIEQGFATRLKSWSDVQNQKIAGTQIAVSVADLKERAWRGQLDKSIADARNELDRLNAISEVYRSEVGAYSASAQVESAASDANLRAAGLIQDRERNRTDVALRNAEIAISQMEELAKLMVSVKQGIAQVSASLASASMSAVNFSAGVHSTRGQSQSCGTSFSYAGSLDDVPTT